MRQSGLVMIGASIYDILVSHPHPTLRALCVGRHEFVAEHIGRYFGKLGLVTECVVGVDSAVDAARHAAPDVILCEYELLTSFPLAAWENDEHLSRTAVIGISLSRRPNELLPLNVNGVAGFLYLPTLDEEDARRVVHAAAISARAHYQQSLPTTFASTRAERDLSAR